MSMYAGAPTALQMRGCLALTQALCPLASLSIRSCCGTVEKSRTADFFQGRIHGIDEFLFLSGTAEDDGTLSHKSTLATLTVRLVRRSSRTTSCPEETEAPDPRLERLSRRDKAKSLRCTPGWSSTSSTTRPSLGSASTVAQTLLSPSQLTTGSRLLQQHPDRLVRLSQTLGSWSLSCVALPPEPLPRVWRVPSSQSHRRRGDTNVVSMATTDSKLVRALHQRTGVNRHLVDSPGLLLEENPPCPKGSKPLPSPKSKPGGTSTPVPSGSSVAALTTSWPQERLGLNDHQTRTAVALAQLRVLSLRLLPSRSATPSSMSALLRWVASLCCADTTVVPLPGVS